MKTRFAPSPTGYIHMGNARTALFNALMGHKRGATFLLRIEDTDTERSDMQYVDALKEDLKWLGLDWQEGPDVEGPNGPYFQSQRGDIYEKYYQQLLDAGLAYPCFCTPTELEVMRKAQAQAGQPPRYDGRCSRLTPEQVAQKKAEGIPYTLRFKVPKGEEVVFMDAIKGRQRFKTDDIGDFIIRKADGAAAFFFSNAIDDALMGVTHVIRGEDHLTNTPRQILLLEALGLPVPEYAHMSMIVGPDGSPLSKRHGSRSIRQLREEGFLPQALTNYMARLGHTYKDADNTLMDLQQLADGFELSQCGTAPARYDENQLRFWQKEAVQALSDEAAAQWLAPFAQDKVPAEKWPAFAALMRDNITLPDEAVAWAERLFEPVPLPQTELSVEVAPGFFEAGAEALAQGADFKQLTEALKATGAKGKQLFQPLRWALTGQLHGPELPVLFELMGREEALRRFRQAAEAAA
ncbi:glutamyl-tRNA synthetase /glutamate--tRNA(Gln) ligase [Sulfurivirga caldicuralii]|uniref:Glutamate--tRNA ligase n=1 Tax=Sulfurivirga caldicuralii TaxID=364032 RepID=A0A1N6F4V1_9GAMM|nr:glutamate--tRNA ligase [Sulfurivirga caldicuralii]SIN90280.1 glutamyl-tRNA synthetase /glutamate--tRNA(Gln) ligase [Sulfurivirga caldicuralii]